MFLGNVLIKLQKPSGSAFFLHCVNSHIYSHIYVGQCWGEEILTHFLTVSGFFFFFVMDNFIYLLLGRDFF